MPAADEIRRIVEEVLKSPDITGLPGSPSSAPSAALGKGVTRARTFTRERRCTLVDYFRII